MDRVKKKGKFVTNKNNKIHMNLQDIIRDHALPYLPAKSLIRCMCICRDWQLQISNTFFPLSQSNCFREVSGYFCQSTSGPPKFFSLDPIAYGVPDPSLSFLPEPVAVRCCSYGLLCCQGFTDYKAYYICNPVTKRWKKLPPHTADHGSNPAIVMAFEPSLLSLNFVPAYKLLCAFPSELGGFKFEIYSSLKGKWRISGAICFGNRNLIPSSGVIAGVIVYWQVWTDDILTHLTGLLAFNLETESATLERAYGGSITNIGVIERKLYSSACNSGLFFVAELNSTTKAWIVKQRAMMDIDEHSGSDVMAVAGNIVLIKGQTRIVAYDMRSRSFTDYGDAADSRFSRSRIVPYVNSLVDI